MSLRIADQGERIDVTLTDDLRHPRYSWPISRISVAIDFDDGPESPADLTLRSPDTDRPVRFQLTDQVWRAGHLIRARLQLLTDLPSGAVRRFTLSRTKMSAEPSGPEAVTTQRRDGTIVLANGLVRIELPAQDMTADSPGGVPAPILRFGDRSRWLGRSRLVTTRPPMRCTVHWPVVGPVVSECVLTYEFPDDRRYRILVRLTAGMEFVELDEEIEGFTGDDAAALLFDLDGPEYTHQYCGNRPVGEPQQAYSEVAWETLGTERDVDGHLPMTLTPYHNWQTRWRLPAVAFWSEHADITTGVFITDMERWNDRQYAIWNSSDTLCVTFSVHAGQLRWHYPLAAGTRSTAVTMYAHSKDIEVVDRTGVPHTYVDSLRRWHGWLPLQKVQSWQLDHVESSNLYPRFFTTDHHGVLGTGRDPVEWLRCEVSRRSPTINSIPTGMERSNHGPTPVGAREFYQYLVPLFDEVAGSLAEGERRDFGATFQFLAYVCADEALMPTRRMLAGHPNFLADVQGVVAQLPFLFPHHPAAQEMADHFERTLARNLKYHTRPDVPAWRARGGRWTENLACYVWGPIDLMVIHSHLLRLFYDGRNRLARPETSAVAHWLLNTLSAPLDRCDGHRTLPAQGAHSHGRLPARSLRVLGQELANTDPLLAEHLLWAAPPGTEDREQPPGHSYDYWTHLQSGPWHDNPGTDPELESAKFTGYGFVLRAAVGTPEEVTVYLQQIDDGPNYRWGRAGRGGNGVIYYYAGGRRYSHNAGEDVGDAATGDAERCTNFGVRKDPTGYKELGPYRSVGINDLTEPLFDFGFAQYAQVNAAGTATPQYRSRSVLLSGTDYFLVYDDVQDGTPGRFSWFVDDDGEFPLIAQLTPGAAADPVGPQTPPQDYSYSHPWIWTKGRHYDGEGHFLTLVSHRSELSVLKVDGGCLVRTGTREDRVFRNSRPQDYVGGDGVRFRGTAGIVRRHDTTAYQAALFAGDRIGIPGITIDTDGETGVSVTGTDAFSGTVTTSRPTQLTVSSAVATPAFTFYIDSEPVTATRDHDCVRVGVPAGTHHWQWTPGPPTPGRARIRRTVNGPGIFTVMWEAMSGVAGYQVQISHDGGQEWQPLVKDVKCTEYTVETVPANTKVHVRVIGHGVTEAGRPSRPYPVYVTTAPPHHPDGLLLRRCTGGIEATWGEILGAGEYRLYRRTGDHGDFSCIFHGPDRYHHDPAMPADTIVEYRVSAVNGNGESVPGPTIDTDPSRTIDWDPLPEEVFRRTTESGEFYDDYDPILEAAMPTPTYPDPERRPWQAPFDTRDS